MSARELQRTAIRMLHDPAFLEQVMCNPEVALSGLDLSRAEIGFLTRSDRRAWQVDGHRAWRVLTTLLSEYAVSVAASREAPHGLAAFFGTPFFHAAIRERRSLSEAFGAWLATRSNDRKVGAMLTLERAMARVRRGVRAVSLTVPEGSLAAWQAAATLLARHGDPVAALVRGARPALPIGRGAEHVLVEAAGAALIDEALHRVLVAEGASRAERLALIVEGGATAEEAEEVLAELVRDGLVSAAQR